MKYLISGGGTGGHIFPAVSIANALRELDSEAQILFVGALGRMEMQRVPEAGYQIVGLPVRGFDRRHLLRNIGVLFDLCRSLIRARRIVRNFAPDVAVGVGGYASGAAMKVAARMGVPVLLQEQNGFAGVTNKLLKNDADVICVAYEGMERFFPKEKIILTGNPVRQNLLAPTNLMCDAPSSPTLLIIGGSLGARTINQAIAAGLGDLRDAGVRVIWQTGKAYFEQCQQAAAPYAGEWLQCTDFLTDMPVAYAQADLVISRAGASSISEICLLGKPAILVPSPNVAEDHQTHNAMALVNKDAAVLVKDIDASSSLVATALSLIKDTARLKTLREHALTMAQPDSARRIAEQVIRLANLRKEK